MGLDYCTECQTLEGEWDGEGDEKTCAECGAEDSYKNIPEHDDGDMER